MKKTDDIETIKKWLENIDEDGFIDSIDASSPTYISGDSICRFGAKGSLVLTIINTEQEVPGIRFFCHEVSLVSFSFNSSLEPFLEKDSFGTRLHLHGKGGGLIVCESLEAEMLDESCWKEK